MVPVGAGVAGTIGGLDEVVPGGVVDVVPGEVVEVGGVVEVVEVGGVVEVVVVEVVVDVVVFELVDVLVALVVDVVLEVVPLEELVDAGGGGGGGGGGGPGFGLVTTVGIPLPELPAGGSGMTGWPCRAPCMKAVQIATGTVPPVSSPTPGMPFIWFPGTREPSPRYIPTAVESWPGVKPSNHAE